MSDVQQLERRVAELENFYTDIPEMMNLRLDRNDAAHAEHSARLSIIDKQLAALTRDVRDMRGGITRQLTGQDHRIASLEERLTGMEQGLTGMEQRLTGMEERLTALELQQQTFESKMTQRLDSVDAQLARVIAILERR